MQSIIEFGQIVTKQEGFKLTLDPQCPLYEVTLSLTGGINWYKNIQKLSKPAGWKLSYCIEICTSGGKHTSSLIATSQGSKVEVELEPLSFPHYKEGSFYPLGKDFFDEVQKALTSAIENETKKQKKAKAQDKLNLHYSEKCKLACEKAGYQVYLGNNQWYVKGTFAYQQKVGKKYKTRYMPNPTAEWLANEKNLL